jgi:hypothetical protein
MSPLSVPQDARKSRMWFDDLPRVLRNAVEQFNFEDSPEFQTLADLSGATRLEGLDVDGDSAVVSNTGWSAPGSVYVTLVYDPNSKESVELSDSYPVTVYFTVNEEEVTIDRIVPDVRSFYE